MRSLALSMLVVTFAAAAGCSSKEDSEAAAAAGAAASNAWSVVPAVSGTRLRAKYVAGGGARELVGFFDTERNEDCTFQRAADGRMRCLPLNVSTTPSGFSDPACKIPTALLPPCGSEAKYAVTYVSGDGNCGGGRVASELRAIAPGKPRYTTGVAGCVLQPDSPPAIGLATLAPLGDVVPWTAFVAAEETLAPGEPVAEKVLVASDGARQHLGFRIEKLGADCTFQLMPDGVTRCVPGGSGGGVIYADSECTQASFVVEYANGPCSKRAEKLWIEPSLGTCTATRAVYSLRDPSDGTAVPYNDVYTQSETFSGPGPASSTVTCSRRGGSSSGGPSAIRRGIEGDLTPSLPATSRVRSGEGRLVPALVASEAPAGVNGAPAALALGWHDNERDADCTFALANDGKLRCLPTGARATIFSTDATCSSPGLVAVPGELACASSGRFARVVTSTCPVKTRIYALGTERRNLSSASNETSPGRCVPVAGVTSALDATEVDPSQFVEGAPAAD